MRPKWGSPGVRTLDSHPIIWSSIKNVKIVVVDTDRYGRTVGIVYLGEVDICREQVSTGNAWVYRRYMTDQSLLSDEQSAQNQGLGLWSESNPVPPWEWRKR